MHRDGVSIYEWVPRISAFTIYRKNCQSYENEALANVC